LIEMPYAPEHSVETRSRILDSARRLFNRNGLTAISIDEVMEGAGLTRGGFYRHFTSKEELYAEAITHFVNAGHSTAWQRQALENRPEGAALARAILDAYLSRAHLDDVEGSCPIIGLATDVARSGDTAKRAYRVVMEMMAGIFAANLGGQHGSANPRDGANNQEQRERALAVVALCVGGMVLARAMDDDGVADELRGAAHRYAVALAGWEDSLAAGIKQSIARSPVERTRR
jgi:TetR/AcrR family transcriptional regulator, transcriptional repressor for nem operon